MSGVVAGADLCALYVPFVYGGRPDPDTVVLPGAWRGTAWPCTGSQKMRAGGQVIGLIECTCPCHTPGEEQHELPDRSNRSAVHPTDVLADPDQRKFWGGGG